MLKQTALTPVLQQIDISRVVIDTVLSSPPARSVAASAPLQLDPVLKSCLYLLTNYYRQLENTPIHLWENALPADATPEDRIDLQKTRQNIIDVLLLDRLVAKKPYNMIRQLLDEATEITGSPEERYILRHQILSTWWKVPGHTEISNPLDEITEDACYRMFDSIKEDAFQLLLHERYPATAMTEERMQQLIEELIEGRTPLSQALMRSMKDGVASQLSYMRASTGVHSDASENGACEAHEESEKRECTSIFSRMSSGVVERISIPFRPQSPDRGYKAAVTLVPFYLR